MHTAAMHTAPDDIPRAIRETKAELRKRIGDYAGAFARAEAAVRAEPILVALIPGLKVLFSHDG